MRYEVNLTPYRIKSVYKSLDQTVLEHNVMEYNVMGHNGLFGYSFFVRLTKILTSNFLDFGL